MLWEFQETFSNEVMGRMMNNERRGTMNDDDLLPPLSVVRRVVGKNPGQSSNGPNKFIMCFESS
jgi:hypothetical protein